MGPLQHHHVFHSLDTKQTLTYADVGLWGFYLPVGCRVTHFARADVWAQRVEALRFGAADGRVVTLVNVWWGGNWAGLRKTHVPCCTNAAQHRNATVTAHRYRTMRCRVEYTPWQTGRKLISGLNPVMHSHWKLPTLLVHVPLCAQTSSRHSLTSANHTLYFRTFQNLYYPNFTWVEKVFLLYRYPYSTECEYWQLLGSLWYLPTQDNMPPSVSAGPDALYPSWQGHRNAPTVFLQVACSPQINLSMHSSTSGDNNNKQMKNLRKSKVLTQQSVRLSLLVYNYRNIWSRIYLPVHPYESSVGRCVGRRTYPFWQTQPPPSEHSARGPQEPSVQLEWSKRSNMLW